MVGVVGKGRRMKCQYCGDELVELHAPWILEKLQEIRHEFYCHNCWSGYIYYERFDGSFKEGNWYEPGDYSYLQDWFASIQKEAGFLQAE